MVFASCFLTCRQDWVDATVCGFCGIGRKRFDPVRRGPVGASQPLYVHELKNTNEALGKSEAYFGRSTNTEPPAALVWMSRRASLSGRMSISNF